LPWRRCSFGTSLSFIRRGFLRAAAKKDATAATRAINGKNYTVVTFTGNNHAKVNGYINDRSEVQLGCS
jgi:hypothetical protein